MKKGYVLIIKLQAQKQSEECYIKPKTSMKKLTAQNCMLEYFYEWKMQ